MTQENFIKRYDALNICDRADLHEVWTNELYKLAKVCDNAEIIDQHTKPGNCCPCIIFEADGFRAVAYLHSDCFRPAMWFGGADGYMSIDYRDMLAVLYGNFANVPAPDYLDELPAPAIEDEERETTDTEDENTATEQTGTLAGRFTLTVKADPTAPTTCEPSEPAEVVESIDTKADTCEAVSEPVKVVESIKNAARVFVLAFCLTAAPVEVEAESIESEAAELTEIVTAEPLRVVADLLAALPDGQRLAHVTIKSA